MEESGKEKWTPGPWSVQPNAHDVPCIVQGPNYRVAVAHRQENRPNEATAAANARLIAAAPALYEALHDLVHGRISDSAKATEATRQRRRDAWENAKPALLLANTGGTENG